MYVSFCQTFGSVHEVCEGYLVLSLAPPRVAPLPAESPPSLPPIPSPDAGRDVRKSSI